VDRFGLLLSARIATKPPGRTRGRAAGTAVVEVLVPYAERLDLWRNEILSMRHAVAVWQQLEAGESRELCRHVLWERDRAGLKAVLFDTHPDLPPGAAPAPPDLRLREAVATREDATGWLDHFLSDDPVLPTRVWLVRVLNRRLQQGLTASFALDDAGNMSLTVCPQNLLQAMWLQLGRAVAEHKTYRRCAVCRDWFELSPEVARTNRRYCSVACRNKEYRDRQERARQMRSEGKTLRVIAEELDTTVESVKRWIESGKKE